MAGGQGSSGLTQGVLPCRLARGGGTVAARPAGSSRGEGWAPSAVSERPRPGAVPRQLSLLCPPRPTSPNMWVALGGYSCQATHGEGGA